MRRDAGRGRSGSSGVTRTRTLVLVLILGSIASACSLLGSVQPTVTPATPSPSPTIPPTAIPPTTPTASPPLLACAQAQLVVRITMWDAGAGHRIATVELTNTGSATCEIAALLQPQLVDGAGTVLIDSAPPTPSAILTVGPGGVLKTLVQDGNYCGPPPLAPVTVAFVLPGGLGRIVATPTSATDTMGVPPCLGAPGSAGDIEMHPWAP